MGQMGVFSPLLPFRPRLWLLSRYSSPAPHEPTFPLYYSMLCCPLKDEQGNTFKAIVFKLVARKSLFYVETVIFDNHNGSCPFPLRGQCCRAFDVPTDVQPIEAKEEIHHWEKHTGKFRVRVKRSMPDRVLCASSGPLRKRCSSAGTAIVLSAHLLLARIIGITVLFAFSRVMSITGDREIA